MADWTNTDGLEVRFINPEAGQLAGGLSTMGAIKTLELDVDFVTAAVTATSDSHAAFLPAGAFIVNAFFIVKTAAVGGTSMSVGLSSKDGTTLTSAAAILSATLGVTANFAVTNVLACDGNRAVAASGIFTKFSNTLDGYVYTTKVGTFTAGTGRIIINYIERD
jgi:hypothetical protein